MHTFDCRQSCELQIMGEMVPLCLCKNLLFRFVDVVITFKSRIGKGTDLSKESNKKKIGVTRNLGVFFLV